MGDMKEMWDQRYSGEEYVYGTLPNLYFSEKITALPPGKLLLPAEGEGRNAVFAAGLGWQVTAVDYSEEGKKKALKLAENLSVDIKYIVDDLAGIDFGVDIYDAVALVYAHFTPGCRSQIHRRIVSCLKPGGLLILEAFNPDQLQNNSGGPKDIGMLYTTAMLEDDFKGLTILQLEETTINLDQGEYHQGDADIIRLYARKKST
jgi:SAM-dependent methyltransferase